MKCEYQEKDKEGRWQPGKCDEPGDRRALDAYGPVGATGYFCGEHALAVVVRTQPRTVVDCPSCGCKIGVKE